MSRLSSLASIPAVDLADEDLLYLVDMSEADPDDASKKLTLENFLTYLAAELPPISTDPTFNSVTVDTLLNVDGAIRLTDNAAQLLGTTSGAALVALLELTADANSVTRFRSGVDLGGFQWTNQAGSTEWMSLVADLLTVAGGGDFGGQLTVHHGDTADSVIHATAESGAYTGNLLRLSMPAPSGLTRHISAETNGIPVFEVFSSGYTQFAAGIRTAQGGIQIYNTGTHLFCAFDAVNALSIAVNSVGRAAFDCAGVGSGITISGITDDILEVYSTGVDQLRVGVGPSDNLRISVDNTGVIDFHGSGSATKFQFNRVAAFSGGSAADPSITFIDDLETGLYLPFAGTMRFSAGGVIQGEVNAAGFDLGDVVVDNLTIDDSFEFAGAGTFRIVAGSPANCLIDLDGAGLREISYGDADSGGAGYRCLRIPNNV